jgi:hypothetical protein
MVIAIALYPPLGGSLPATLLSLVIMFVPSVILLVLVIYDRVERHARAVRIMFVLVAAVTVLFAGFYFLNGALDARPPVEIQAVVFRKGIYRGRYGGRRWVEVSFAGNQNRISDGIVVSLEMYRRMEPGDSVRLAIHPGAFSTPWYGDGILSSGEAAIRLNPR